MRIEINKILEFIYALQVIIKIKHGDDEGQLSFIEAGNFDYIHELHSLLIYEDFSELERFFKYELQDCADTTILGVALDDAFNFKYEPPIHTDLSKEQIEYYVSLIRNIAKKVNWNKFYDEHKEYYDSLIEKFSKFPDNFSFDSYIDFYKVIPNEFIYNPTVLVNGGFGISDDSTRFYYIKGFEYNYNKNDFKVNLKYILETLYHEFSHPVINPLVDKYFDLINDPIKLYDEAVKHNLYTAYMGDARVIYYEYMVRSVACYLTDKYYPGYDKDYEYLSEHGFNLLEDFVNLIRDNEGKYSCFEDMYVNAIIPYINTLELGSVKKYVRS